MDGNIQQQSKEILLLALAGNDVIGQARTGSETGAFGVPIIEACQPTGNLQSLILAPTRELANQVSVEMNNIQGDSGLKLPLYMVALIWKNRHAN